MSESLYHKIIDETQMIPLITTIHMMGMNEPLLDRRLEEFIRYAKDKRPDIKIGIYTNGLLLTPDRHDSLRAAGLDEIVVSLNAVNAEQHEATMGMKGKFDKVVSNVEYAVQQPHTLWVHAVHDGKRFDKASIQAFYARWGDKRTGGHGLVIQEGNWAGDIDAPAAGIVLSNLACHRALYQIYVTFDGKITTCCFDPLGRQIFGDLNIQTIREVYSSKPYLQFRKAHAENRADEYNICKGCTRI
jgi:MoaA/NifB/PqqE/SkfB family radical SAM enzyme